MLCCVHASGGSFLTQQLLKSIFPIRIFHPGEKEPDLKCAPLIYLFLNKPVTPEHLPAAPCRPQTCSQSPGSSRSPVCHIPRRLTAGEQQGATSARERPDRRGRSAWHRDRGRGRSAPPAGTGAAPPRERPARAARSQQRWRGGSRINRDEINRNK